MKQLLTICLSVYLSLISILPTAVWEECVKIPQLWEHYQLHKQADPDLSLATFISMHYGEASPGHQNQHDHSQIPFKTAHHCLGLNWQITFLPFSLTKPLLHHQLVFQLTQRPIFHYSSLSLIERTFSFFHPPRARMI